MNLNELFSPVLVQACWFRFMSPQNCFFPESLPTGEADSGVHGFPGALVSASVQEELWQRGTLDQSNHGRSDHIVYNHRDILKYFRSLCVSLKY